MRARLPVKLIYAQGFATRKEASLPKLSQTKENAHRKNDFYLKIKKNLVNHIDV